MVHHLCSFVNIDDVCHRKGGKLKFCLVLQGKLHSAVNAICFDLVVGFYAISVEIFKV